MRLHPTIGAAVAVTLAAGVFPAAAQEPAGLAALYGGASSPYVRSYTAGVLKDSHLAEIAKAPSVPDGVVRATLQAKARQPGLELDQDFAARATLEAIGQGRLDQRLAKSLDDGLALADLRRIASDPGTNPEGVIDPLGGRVPTWVLGIGFGRRGHNTDIVLGGIDTPGEPPLKPPAERGGRRMQIDPSGTHVTRRFYPKGFTETVMLGRSGRLECSGTLITSTWLVTAAHCLEGWDGRGAQGQRQLKVYAANAGGSDTLTPPSWVKATTPQHDLLAIDIEWAKQHGRWREMGRGRLYDVGVAQLAQPVPNARPARLISALPGAGRTPVTIAGYGKTLDPRDNALGLDVGWQSIDLWDKTLLSWAATAADPTSGLSPASSNCVGDSGGPVFLGDYAGYADEPTHELAAVISGSSDDKCISGQGYVVNLADQDIAKFICTETGQCTALAVAQARGVGGPPGGGLR